jgi:hypothetical protein
MSEQQQQQQQTPWYQTAGFEGELLGHMQTKGWDKLDPAAAAKAAVTAAREAEKMVGVPADQFLKLPKAADDVEGWKKVHARLGVPAEAKDYDLSGVKHANGNALAENLAQTLRDMAHANNIPKDRVTAIAGTLVKHLDGIDAERAAVETAALAKEKAALTENWGKNFEANKFVAGKAANALGITPEHLEALTKVTGYKAVMEMFLAIGQKIGEDKFISADGSPGGKGPMTKEQAQARVKELQADSAWGKRYTSGGNVERREMDALMAIIAGS